MNLFDINKVRVGQRTYGPLHVIDGRGPSRLSIGAYCSIAGGVVFILNGGHGISSLLSFPLRTFVLRESESALSKGDIIVEDDVWIGQNAIVLSGVRLGQGSVIGAGAVVTRDVPAYEVVAGVPARSIAARFPDDFVARLRRFDFGALDEPFVRRNIDILESTLTIEHLAELESRLQEHNHK